MMTALTDAKIDLASADYRNGVVGKEIVANLLLEKRDLLQKMKISKLNLQVYHKSIIHL